MKYHTKLPSEFYRLSIRRNNEQTRSLCVYECELIEIMDMLSGLFEKTKTGRDLLHIDVRHCTTGKHGASKSASFKGIPVLEAEQIIKNHITCVTQVITL